MEMSVIHEVTFPQNPLNHSMDIKCVSVIFSNVPGSYNGRLWGEGRSRGQRVLMSDSFERLAIYGGRLAANDQSPSLLTVLVVTGGGGDRWWWWSVVLGS